ncbi:MAG: hypothetical protein ACFE0Q_05170 [Anaerolineae bacterium]
MTVQYFVKVHNMQAVEVAIAHTDQQAQNLRQQKFETCSRTVYESALRTLTQLKLATAK